MKSESSSSQAGEVDIVLANVQDSLFRGHLQALLAARLQRHLKQQAKYSLDERANMPSAILLSIRCQCVRDEIHLTEHHRPYVIQLPPAKPLLLEVGQSNNNERKHR